MKIVEKPLPPLRSKSFLDVDRKWVNHPASVLRVLKLQWLKGAQNYFETMSGRDLLRYLDEVPPKCRCSLGDSNCWGL